MNREQCAEKVNDALCIVQEALNDIKAALDCLGCAECCEERSDFQANLEQADESLTPAIAAVRKALRITKKLNDEEWYKGIAG
jgi:hypothetical protein